MTLHSRAGATEKQDENKTVYILNLTKRIFDLKCANFIRVAILGIPVYKYNCMKSPMVIPATYIMTHLLAKCLCLFSAAELPRLQCLN